MQSAGEMELFKMVGGKVKAVCSWIGNNKAAAIAHYAQVTETGIQEAAKMSLLAGAEQAAQKAAQYKAVNGSNGHPNPRKKTRFYHVLHRIT